MSNKEFLSESSLLNTALDPLADFSTRCLTASSSTWHARKVQGCLALELRDRKAGACIARSSQEGQNEDKVCQATVNRQSKGAKKEEAVPGPGAAVTGHSLQKRPALWRLVAARRPEESKSAGRRLARLACSRPPHSSPKPPCQKARSSTCRKRVDQAELLSTTFQTYWVDWRRPAVLENEHGRALTSSSFCLCLHLHPENVRAQRSMKQAFKCSSLVCVCQCLQRLWKHQATPGNPQNSLGKHLQKKP